MRMSHASAGEDVATIRVREQGEFFSGTGRLFLLNREDYRPERGCPQFCPIPPRDLSGHAQGAWAELMARLFVDRAQKHRVSISAEI